MVNARPNKQLSPRRAPLQQRSQERSRHILAVTAALLEEVGFNTLTTILIAREMGISVGTLYHYFPNKHAILYALAEQWLQEVDAALMENESWHLAEMPLALFVERLIDRQLSVYQKQQGILHLVQAMFSVPELRELDQRHDALVIERMTRVFARYGLNGSMAELGRVARVYLELVHALLLVVVNQSGNRARRTLADLKRLTICLLQPYVSVGGSP